MKYHKNLSKASWNRLSLVEQMANVGSEVSRTTAWKGKDKNDADLSFRRTIELFNLILNDPKNSKRLKEVTRSKELFIDWYLGSGIYKVSEKQLNDYFLRLAILARCNR